MLGQHLGVMEEAEIGVVGVGLIAVVVMIGGVVGVA